MYLIKCQLSLDEVVYLKRSLAMFVLRLLVGPPVQQNPDAAFLNRTTIHTVKLFAFTTSPLQFVSISPCCRALKCEVQCSLRRFEKPCPLHKTADAPSVEQSRSGKPFKVRNGSKLLVLRVQTKTG